MPSFDGTAAVLNQKHGSCAAGLFVSTFWIVRGFAGAKRRRKQAGQHVRFALQERECCFLYLRTRGSAQWSKANGICRHWRHGVMQAELQPNNVVHVHSGLLWGLQCQGFAKWDAACKHVKVVAMRCLHCNTQRVQLQQCFSERRRWHPEPEFSEDEVEELHSDSSSEESDSSSEVSSSMERWCSSLPADVAKERDMRARMKIQSGSQSLSLDGDSDFVLEDSASESLESDDLPSVVEHREVKLLHRLASKWYAPVKKDEKRARIKQEVKHEVIGTVEESGSESVQGKVGVRASRSTAYKLLFGGICNGDAYWAKYTVQAFWRSTQSHHFPKSYVRANLHRIADMIECCNGFIHKCELAACLK